MADTKKVLDVVVIGGSLGGLFTALVFKGLGHHVRILERTPSALLHNQGAGIVFGGPAQDFFNKYDRTNSKLYVTSHTRQYLNKKGEVIDTEQSKQLMTSWDLLYNVLRRNFDGGGEDEYFDPENLKSLDDGNEEGDGEYMYGKKVSELKAAGNESVQVDFEDKDGKKESLTADWVFGADGPSSTVRNMFEPDTERTNAGYVAWRGTVLESEVSEEARKIFSEKFTFFHRHGQQILAYLIPGENGSLVPGKRLVNYVWYCNYAPDSSAFKDLMTDTHGSSHRFTLPAGLMQPLIWTQQKAYAAESLPPQFLELVQKTEHPFVQVITDVLSKKHVFLDGKVVLVGDAVCGLRPHTAASTSQAARHALMLEGVMNGDVKIKDWERETTQWAAWMAGKGRVMGDKSQFGSHPLQDDS